MSKWKLLSLTFGIAVLACLAPVVNSQISSDAARQLALSTVRSKSPTASNRFLSIHREEGLEESLAAATVGWRSGPEFIYRVSEAGVEIKGNSIVNHIAMDGDPTYIVAISSTDRTAYCIHGCGPRESLAEFEGLMAEMKLRLGNPDQAEALADFYRQVNPQNYEDLGPVASLLELKQAAERQCVGDAKSFAAGEVAFNAWWKHAESLYGSLPFRERAFPQGNGYQVEWIVTSSSSRKSCGGAALRADLEISSDGRVVKLTFSDPGNQTQPR